MVTVVDMENSLVLFFRVAQSSWSVGQSVSRSTSQPESQMVADLLLYYYTTVLIIKLGEPKG